jgi:hypothetical protein
MELPTVYFDDESVFAAAAQCASGSAAAAAPFSAGASPSNTPPAISIPGEVEVLLTGIDSLYVSYQGSLKPNWDVLLSGCKECAQSESPEEQLKAQVEICEHLFVVHERGSGRFAYVLSDNWFRIAIARPSAKSMPVVHVQISSESLLLEGVERVLGSLADLVDTISVPRSGPHVSRSDLRVDFVTTVDLAGIDVYAWVTRARDKAKRFVGRDFSGWSIGLGGNVSGRLYNKLLELDKSRKSYMRDIWSARGWDGVNPVMRLEFQLEREALRELGVDVVPDLIEKLPALWMYCTEDWLQLKVPNFADDTPSRWVTDPFWLAMSRAWDSTLGVEPAARVRKERIPNDDRLFLQGFGGITSFMASRGITDPAEGFAQYIQEARQFHSRRKTPFGAYVRAKVLDKGRRYSTIRTHMEAVGEPDVKLQCAARNGKGKDGE